MKIATWNVNGVRKRRDEVALWVQREQPDVLCLQEIKALPDQIPETLRSIDGYWSFWHGGKGYSGVALLLSKERFMDEPTFEHPPFDFETRIVLARTSDVSFVSTYVPNGGKDFVAKMRYLQALESWSSEQRSSGRSVVVCGDLNVARSDMDVHPTERRAVVGQLPEERALIEGFLAHGLVDLLRQHHPENDRLFTWWAPWRNMRQRNIGWRLDYVVVGEALRERSIACNVHCEYGTSDHAPLVATFQD